LRYLVLTASRTRAPLLPLAATFFALLYNLFFPGAYWRLALACVVLAATE
jgi:hypothetical protein